MLPTSPFGAPETKNVSKVQTTGVAPTDDCFTVIAPGVEDTDRDGPALVGNPGPDPESDPESDPILSSRTYLK